MRLQGLEFDRRRACRGPVNQPESWKEIIENYPSANPSLEPNVTFVVNAGSLEFSISYVVDYMKRTSVKDQLFTKIVEEVAKSNGRLEWAPTTIRAVT